METEVSQQPFIWPLISVSWLSTPEYSKKEIQHKACHVPHFSTQLLVLKHYEGTGNFVSVPGLCQPRVITINLPWVSSFIPGSDVQSGSLGSCSNTLAPGWQGCPCAYQAWLHYNWNQTYHLWAALKTCFQPGQFLDLINEQPQSAKCSSHPPGPWPQEPQTSTSHRCD